MKIRLLLISIFLFQFSFLYANEKVTLQLKWFHQFQFAGYYAAKEKGFYEDVGLDVEIKERDISLNNINQVINNDAEYGISDSILMLYKSKKQPVVIVSPIFQHSASVLMSLKSSGINSPYELDNKNIIFYSNDTDGFSILAMLKKLNIKPNLIRKREKNDYLKLMNGEVDLSPAYLSNEPYYFKEKNIDINIINPMNYGFDLYGDMIFTNENEALNHPDRVKKFKEASLKGWEYALNNQEEIIQLIHKKYNSIKSIKHLRYEAKAIEKLISKDLIPLGSLDKGRIEFISNLYHEYGLFSDKLDIRNFIFEDYIQNKSKVNLTKEEQSYLETHPILKVQGYNSFPPYNFTEDNKVLGYSIDYINLIGKILNINIEYVNSKSFEEYLQNIKTDKTDIIPSIAITEERKKFITYTNFKHIDYQVSFGIKKGSNIKSFNDLENKTIAVLNKSFLHRLLKSKYPKQKLYLTGTIKEAVESVANGKADAVIDNLATIEYYKNKFWLSNIDTLILNNIEFIPNKTPLYMGVAKDNLILKSIFEKVSEQIPYSKIIELQRKWLNIEFKNDINWTDNEIKYLHNKSELNYCIDSNWLPFEKIEKNEHIGMTAEYIKIFQNKIPIPIKLYETNSWLNTLTSAKERKCDFITVMIDTNERREYFNFTHNLMNLPLVVATKQDKPFISDLNNILSKKIGIISGFAYESILKEEYPNINIVEVKDAYEGLLKVNENEIYGFIDVLPVVGYNIQKNFVGNLKISGKVNNNIGFSMATRNDEPLLNDIFNKLIENISEEKKQEILNKWLSIKFEESIDYEAIAYIVMVFLIIILIIVIKNRAIYKINLKMEESNKKLSKYINLVDENVLTSSTNKKGVINYVSQAFCDISGYTKEELIGNRHRIVRHPDTPKELFVEMWKTISSGKRWEGEIKNKKKNGDYYWVKAYISPIFDDKNKIIGYTAIRHDITDKKRVEEISITDELTTLYNKRYFNETFEKELNRAKRHNYAFALIILDVDYFKLYNDNYGHQKGDYVLETIGKELKHICQRSSDIAYRIGGEEFAITFTPSSKDDSINFAKLINKKIELLEIEHKFNKASSNITVSIGVYTDIGDKLLTTKEIYSLADSALYKAKAKGRNTFFLYEK